MYNMWMYKQYQSTYNFTIATDAHYLEKTDLSIFKVFLNSKSSGEREVDSFYSHTYVMDWNEVASYFKDFDSAWLEEARLNTLRIAARVQPYNLEKPPTIPKISIPKRFDLSIVPQAALKYEYLNKYMISEFIEDRYLIYSMFKNYSDLIAIDYDHEKVYDRLNMELEQLWLISEKLEQRMSNYLITVAKTIDIIWSDADALVGTSRGSAAAWVTNYLLRYCTMERFRLSY